MSKNELTPMENGRVWGIVYHDGKFHIHPGGLETHSRDYVQGPWGLEENLHLRVDGFVRLPGEGQVWRVTIYNGDHVHDDDTYREESEASQYFLALHKPNSDDIFSDVLVLSGKTVPPHLDTVYEGGYLVSDPKFPSSPEDLERIQVDAPMSIGYADQFPRKLWPKEKR